MEYGGIRMKNRLTGAVLILLVSFMGACGKDSTLNPESSCRYYEYIDLDSPPRLVKYVPPEYPPISKENGIEGTVIVRVTINCDGEVCHSELIRSDVDKACERSAKQAAREFLFNPAVKDGANCGSTMSIPIRFKIHGGMV